MYVCICAFWYIYIHVLTFSYACLYIYLYCVCMLMYMYVCMLGVYLFVYVSICEYVNVLYVYIHLNICMLEDWLLPLKTSHCLQFPSFRFSWSPLWCFGLRSSQWSSFKQRSTAPAPGVSWSRLTHDTWDTNKSLCKCSTCTINSRCFHFATVGFH